MTKPQQETNTLRRASTNLVSLIVSQLLVIILGLLLTMVIARELGTAVYGQYVIALSFANLFGFGIELGIPRIITRFVARDPESGGRVIVNSLLIYFTTIIPMSLIVLFISIILQYDDQIIVLIMATWLSNFTTGLFNVYRMHLHGLQKMVVDSGLQVLQFTLMAGGGILALNLGYGILGVIVVSFLSSLFTLGIAHIYASRQQVNIQLGEIDPAFARLIVTTALPLTLGAVFHAFYLRADAIILSLFESEQVVGEYGAAYGLIVQIAQLALMINMAFFPIIAQRWDKGVQETVAFANRTLLYITLIGIPIGVGLLSVAPELIAFIFGPEFIASVPLLQILSFRLFFSFTSSHLGMIATAIDRQRWIMIATAIGAGINGILNLIFIPLYGAYAAAATTVLTELILIAVYWTFLRRVIPIKGSLFRMSKAILASVVMAIVVMNIDVGGLLLKVPIGGLVYLSLILVLRVIDREDRELIRSIIDRRRKQ